MEPLTVHAKWTTRCSSSSETLMSIDLCICDKWPLRFFIMANEWSKPITILQICPKRNNFSPIGFRSEMLQLVGKKTNFCSKKQTSVVYEILIHSIYLCAIKNYLKNNLHYQLGTNVHVQQFFDFFKSLWVFLISELEKTSSFNFLKFFKISKPCFSKYSWER